LQTELSEESSLQSNGLANRCVSYSNDAGEFLNRGRMIDSCRGTSRFSCSGSRLRSGFPYRRLDDDPLPEVSG
jgi:hypothetical protein